jgi:hypothetical protein
LGLVRSLTILPSPKETSSNAHDTVGTFMVFLSGPVRPLSCNHARECLPPACSAQCHSTPSHSTHPQV